MHTHMHTHSYTPHTHHHHHTTYTHNPLILTLSPKQFSSRNIAKDKAYYWAIEVVQPESL